MEQGSQKSWAYRMASRLFDAAFDESKGLSDAEQQLLMQEVSVRALQRMPKSNGIAESSESVTVVGVSVKVEKPS
jgi:hypothetical protein